MARLRLCILGATGSVGANTLDVASRHPERFEVFALSAHRQVDALFMQCTQWMPRFAALRDEVSARELARRLREAGVRTEVLHGPQSLCDLASHPDVDAVMGAIVGAAGLAPCMAAVRAGKRLLLANKEVLVVGGASFMHAVQVGGATLLPIDSEHSAIFQCLPEDRSTWPAGVDHIVLTASGGPFLDRDPATLHLVTPEQACAHPNWVMGRKISVDSATMMNKALEVIEARWLFDLAPEQIRVVIHAQSVIHSMVVCRDGSVLAQLGAPDMRVPISYGLAWPERIASGAAALDLSSLATLTFQAPDSRRFPCLQLAWETLRGPAGSTAVLNAANEEAVEAFLDRRIGFDAIHHINVETLAAVPPDLPALASVEEMLELDARARRHASKLAKAMQ